MLHKVKQRSLVYSRHSRAHRRRVDCAWIDESCRNSTQMERIPVSCRKLFWRDNSILQAGLIAGGKDTKRRATDILHSLGPFWGRRRMQSRFIEAEKSAPEQMEGFSGRLLDQFGQGTRERITILADKVWRHSPLRFSASRPHCQNGMPSRTKNCIEGFPRLVQQKPILSWSQNSRNSTQWSTWRWRKSDPNSWIKLGTEYRTELRPENSTDSWNPERQFKDEERSTCTNWEKFPRKFSARPVASAGQRDWLYCTCGMCIMPSSEHKRKIKSQFEILSVPYYIVKTGRERKIQLEMRSTETLPSDGRRTVVDFWIHSRHLISHTPPQEVSAKDRRIIVRLESMIRDQNRDRWNTDLISRKHFTSSPLCDSKRERRIRTFPNTCEPDNVQLKKKRDWNVNWKLGVGSIGHSLLPLLLQHGDVHKYGKSHKNGKDGKNGKNKYSDLWVVILQNEPLQKWQDHQSFFAEHLHMYSPFVFQGFRSQAIAIPL